jgi:hypothetical protein
MLWQIPLAAQMHSLQSAFNILPARPALSTCPSRCWWSCWNSTALHQLRAWSMTTSYLLQWNWTTPLVPVRDSLSLLHTHSRQHASVSSCMAWLARHPGMLMQQPGGNLCQLITTYMLVLQSSSGADREYEVRLYADSQRIWSTTRRLAKSGTRYSFPINVAWYTHNVSVTFRRALYAPAPVSLPAYGATLRLYTSALQVGRPYEAQLGNDGAQSAHHAESGSRSIGCVQLSGAVTGDASDMSRRSMHTSCQHSPRHEPVCTGDCRLHSA